MKIPFYLKAICTTTLLTLTCLEIIGAGIVKLIAICILSRSTTESEKALWSRWRVAWKAYEDSEFRKIKGDNAKWRETSQGFLVWFQILCRSCSVQYLLSDHEDKMWDSFNKIKRGVLKVSKISRITLIKVVFSSVIQRCEVNVFLMIYKI